MRERLGMLTAPFRDVNSDWHLGSMWRYLATWGAAILLAQLLACTFWGAVFLPGFKCTSPLCNRTARNAGDTAECEYAMRHYMREDGLFNLEGDPLPYNPQHNWQKTGIRLFVPGVEIN